MFRNFVLSVLLVGCSSMLSMGDVLNFDDLPTDDDFLQVPLNYEGFMFGLTGIDEWGTIDDTFYMNTFGNTYGSPSGEVAIYNWLGAETSYVLRDDTFDFIGASFTGLAAFDQFDFFTSTSITVEGYRDGDFVDSATMQLSADQYDFLEANIDNVDELRFINSGGQVWFLMDDFTYQTSVIPEPSSAVVLIGFFGMLIRRQR